MERDAPELPGIVIVMSGATRAMQRAMNLQQLMSLSHLSTMAQTGGVLSFFAFELNIVRYRNRVLDPELKAKAQGRSSVHM